MSKSSAILVLVVLLLVCSRIVLYFSKQNTRVLNEAFQFQCTVSTKSLQSDQSLAVNNSNTHRCTKSHKVYSMCLELHTIVRSWEMWTANCCSDDRIVSAGGSLKCPHWVVGKLWRKSELSTIESKECTCVWARKICTFSDHLLTSNGSV